MKQRMVGVSSIVALICMGLAGVTGAADKPGATTLDNLQTAYNGESNAKVRYEAFAAKAEEENYKSIAVLFRAAADSAAIHVRNLAGQIKKLDAKPKTTLVDVDMKSTKANLEASLKGEVSADGSMYSAFIKQAEATKDPAVMAFKGAYVAEIEQSKFFKAALGAMDDWKTLGMEFAVCQVCGYIVMGQPPKTCPICAAPQDKFKIFAK